MKKAYCIFAIIENNILYNFKNIVNLIVHSFFQNKTRNLNSKLQLFVYSISLYIVYNIAFGVQTYETH